MVETVGRITFAGCQDVDEAPEYRTIPVRNAPSQVMIDEAYKNGYNSALEEVLVIFKTILRQMKK